MLPFENCHGSPEPDLQELLAMLRLASDDAGKARR
jgi:hypothetical protein